MKSCRLTRLVRAPGANHARATTERNGDITRLCSLEAVLVLVLVLMLLCNGLMRMDMPITVLYGGSDGSHQLQSSMPVSDAAR